MVSIRISEWLFPQVKKERDLLALQVHDLKQEIERNQFEILSLTMEVQKWQSVARSAEVPRTPKILRVGSAAEIRRLTEKAFEAEEAKRMEEN